MGAIVDQIKVKGAEIPLIYEESEILPVVNLQIVFQQSGSTEDGNLSGLSRMSAKILQEGTKKEGTVEFARQLEERAINLSISSGTETMVMDISCLEEQFDQALKLAKKLIKNPNLTEDAFQKVLTSTRSTINYKKSDYDYTANMDLHGILFEGTAIASPNLGTEESIEKITLKKVEKFLRDHMVLDRAIVLVGGKISLDSAKEKAASLLKTFERGNAPKKLHFETIKTPKNNELLRDTQQAYIYFGSPFHIQNMEKDLYKAKVAAFILGSSGFGSRMMEEIRVKRGLAYSAYMRININKTHSYSFGYLQTKLENQEKASQLVEELVQEFVKKGATKKELESAKKFLLGSEPLRNETLSQRLNAAFSEYYKGLPVGYRKQELEMIQNLTLKELNDFITSHKELTQLSFSVITHKPAEEK